MTVEAELSDWLKAETAREEQRRKAEELFERYEDIHVKTKGGRFTSLRGSEADVDELEEQLKSTFGLSDDCGGTSELCGNDPAQLNEDDVVRPVHTNQQQQLMQQGESSAVSSSEPSDDSLLHRPNGPEDSQGTPSPPPTQRDQHGARTRVLATDQIRQHFTDEMDVEKHLYNYMVFKHSKSLGEITTKYSCSYGLKRTAADAKQYRLQVSADTKEDLTSAFDALARLVVKLTEEDIMDRKVELYQKERLDELQAALEEMGVLIMASPCRLIGPADTLDPAQSKVVTAAFHKAHTRNSHPAAETTDIHYKDNFMFYIASVKLTVHVRQGIQHLLFYEF